MRVAAARGIEDLAQRAGLDAGVLTRLAESGALRGIGGDRLGLDDHPNAWRLRNDRDDAAKTFNQTGKHEDSMRTVGG